MFVFHGHISSTIILYRPLSCQLISLVFLACRMYNSMVLVIETEEMYPL